MRLSKCFIPTLRESPAGVETAAEKLIVRAAYARAVSTGVYGYLPLGIRSLARRMVCSLTATSANEGTRMAPTKPASCQRCRLRRSGTAISSPGATPRSAYCAACWPATRWAACG